MTNSPKPKHIELTFDAVIPKLEVWIPQEGHKINLRAHQMINKLAKKYITIWKGKKNNNFLLAWCAHKVLEELNKNVLAFHRIIQIVV